MIDLVLTVLMHEAGHAIATLANGLRIKRVGISWKGVYIVRESGSPAVNAQVALAGPLMNLVLALLTAADHHHFAVLNLIFAIVNLLPLPHSDGSHALAHLRQQNQ